MVVVPISMPTEISPYSPVLIFSFSVKISLFSSASRLDLFEMLSQIWYFSEFLPLSFNISAFLFSISSSMLTTPNKYSLISEMAIPTLLKSFIFFKSSTSSCV